MGLLDNDLFANEINNIASQTKEKRKPGRMYAKEMTEAEKKSRAIYQMFNQKQKEAFDIAMRGENMFITGGGGVGKSFLLTGIVQSLRDVKHKNVLVCAPTGVAAHNVSGVTIHKQFNFPTSACLKETKTRGTHPIRKANKALKCCDVLVLDEVSMIRIDVFDSIYESVLKANVDRRNRNLSDIQFIVMGDFFQLPPVITEEDKEILEGYYNNEDNCVGGELKNGYAFYSTYWNELKFHNILLTEVVRQKDYEFVRHLNEIREGYPVNFHYFNQASAEAPIEDAICLFPYNADVNAENIRQLSLLEGNPYTFKAILSRDATPEDCGYNYELSVKVGAKVMFTVNDDPHRSEDLIMKRPSAWKEKSMFVNGTLGIVCDIHQDISAHDEEYITVKILDTGEYVDIRRCTYKIETYEPNDEGTLEKKEKGRYRQFPIMLAFACSIHRSQGKTFKAVNIDPNSFTAGQFYVAISRATDIKSVYLQKYVQYKNVFADQEVINFYKQLKEGKSD